MASKDKRRRRRTLLRRDGSFCCYCWDEFPEHLLTIEHVVARRDGGEHALSNLKLACYPCNHGRHNRLPPAG